LSIVVGLVCSTPGQKELYLFLRKSFKIIAQQSAANYHQV
jgi:hypothetical protein